MNLKVGQIRETNSGVRFRITAIEPPGDYDTQEGLQKQVTCARLDGTGAFESPIAVVINLTTLIEDAIQEPE